MSTEPRLNAIRDRNEYVSVHRRIAKILPKPRCCETCGKVRRLDLANKSGQYKESVGDWQWLCRRCHMESDGRISALVIRNTDAGIKRRQCPNCGKSVPRASSKHCSRKCYFSFYWKL